MATKFGTNASCGSTGAVVTVNGSGCTALGGNLSTYFSATPPPAVVACTAAATTDATKVSTKQDRYCEVPSACQEDVCSGTVAAGFSACVFTDGDVACPAGWSARTTVGDDAGLSCSACTGCTASAACASGKIHFFSDGACGTSAVSLDVNDTCESTNGAVKIGSFIYSAVVSGPQCNGTGPKTASVSLTAPRTVCCK
jgi:hypothetical protein